MAIAPTLISPLTSIAQTAMQSDVPPEDKTEGNKFSSPMDDYLNSQAEYNKALQAASESLTNRNPTNYFSIAGQFLKPTMTGSFGESLGNAAGEMGRQQEQERLNAPAIAQMRAQIAKQKMDTTKGSIIKTASRSIFTPVETKGEDGKPKTTYKINTGAINDIMRFSDNPIKDLADYATAIPKLRSAGMLGDKSTQGTPFDAIALLAPNDLIKKQAVRFAEQYKDGSMDPDKADAIANQMVTMATASIDRNTANMDRNAQNEFKNMIAGMMLQLKQTEAENKREASLKTMTDEQKIKFNKIVVPIINESAKANTALTMLDQIEETIAGAPSGALSGAYAKSIGALFGTDDNTALRQLESMSKALLPQVPRLPGAASNLDAKNIEKGLGELQDIRLTNAQRVEILQRIRTSFQSLADRGFEIQTYWDANKDVHPMVTKRNATPPPPAGGTTPPPAGGGSKSMFRVIGTEPAGGKK